MRTVVATGAAVAACAVVGSIATREVDSGWYRALRKPVFQPPTAVFPIAWTALYTDLAVTSARAIDALGPAEQRAYVRALGANLVLNAGWCWVEFKAHRLGAATLVAGALAASSVDLVRRTGRAEGRSGAALAPYAAWCTFATALSAGLWRLNRS